MSDKTSIEWCDATWSPWEGCTKVGPGCDHCYAESMNRWLRKGANWGSGAPRREFSEAHWRKPIVWNTKAAEIGKPLSVFPSICDPFDNEAPAGLRDRFLDLVRGTPNLTWLLLTKRIGNVKRMTQVPWTNWPGNAWIGETIVNQDEADRDVDKLLELPAPVHFISYEPALGPVDFTRWLPLPTCRHCGHPEEAHGFERTIGCQAGDGSEASPICGCRKMRGEADHDTSGKFTYARHAIDWIIAGGESGRSARPMNPQWVRDLRDQCAAAGVPFLFKQWGEYASVSEVEGPGAHFTFPDGATVRRVGKHLAGRLLDGREHNEFPEAA